jgi:hypothetical protein
VDTVDDTPADDVTPDEVAELLAADNEEEEREEEEEDDTDSGSTVPFLAYMLSRFGPPQYSVVLPLQVMLQPVRAGVLPATSAEPAIILSPQ